MRIDIDGDASTNYHIQNDSEGLCNQAFLDLLPHLNDTVESLIQQYRGKKVALILADLEFRLCQKLPDTFEQHYRQRVAERFARELKPMPGVVEMLEATTSPKCMMYCFKRTIIENPSSTASEWPLILFR